MRPPHPQDLSPDAHFVAVTLTSSSNAEAAPEGGSDEAPYGMIVVCPAGADRRTQWASTREIVLVALTTDALKELADSELERKPPELLPPPDGTVDLQAVRMAELMAAELRNQEVNELYADALVTVFGIHLLRNYSRAARTAVRPKGGLSTTAAKRVEEYIEENFARRLGVAELAAVCELSHGHFIQSFTKSFGEPPHRYLINRRLEFAEQLLVEKDLTIAEVAFLSGFSSQSHLTSAMRKNRNITPAQLRMRR
ncbi:AraC family transcriptional regulator [Chelativorans sp. M5D2P16]|uniref:AraC family transcriptional regulator n=1 Tax=Chelativorans sp. M5D2P16 TaxID=3095678 RepID=UPI002ACA9C7E|nr:AraC family transcriptional regulator [Chelativorans sp. M5D2P16]MDZ5700108.1 AraC family transcriptional regulator [Chelativorans sp. M5D2P16]